MNRQSFFTLTQSLSLIIFLPRKTLTVSLNFISLFKVFDSTKIRTKGTDAESYNTPRAKQVRERSQKVRHCKRILNIPNLRALLHYAKRLFDITRSKFVIKWLSNNDNFSHVCSCCSHCNCVLSFSH